MRLSELSSTVDRLPGTEMGDDPEISSLFFDSRKAAAGGLFFAVPGDVTDGHDHAADAIAGGAIALVVERKLEVAVPQVLVADCRAAMAPIAARFYGNPSEALTVVGVTGTNGKTTIVSMIASVAGTAGLKSQVIGTLTGARTTPEAIDLQAELAAAVADGVELIAMEVSSHALVQRRSDHVAFDAAIFTNLTVDHLDYHESMESYYDAKALLFSPGRSSTAVLWTDDPYGRRLADTLGQAEGSPEVIAVGEHRAQIDRVDVASSRFRWNGRLIDLPMGGRFNVANALLAAEAAQAVGIGADIIASGLTGLSPVPGRFEPIESGQPFGVIVDYSHTPDSLVGALETANAVAEGRVIVVFGAGGDRDRSKRPMMGAVAYQNADLTILTSDNPRSEDPETILDQIQSGLPDDASDGWQREVDRRSAIHAALSHADPGDVVLIAGKGHEATQTIGTDVLPFDDRQVARDLLAEMGFDANSGGVDA